MTINANILVTGVLAAVIGGLLLDYIRKQQQQPQQSGGFFDFLNF